MTNLSRCGLASLVFCGSGLLASADSVPSAEAVTISTAGTFSSTDSHSGIAVPGASWNLSFDVLAKPEATNIGSDGFDVPFSNFQLTVANTPISSLPASIRLFGSDNSGQFTLFFGPESGTDPRTGNFIPELVFSGDQLFYGSTQDPLLTTDTFNVSEVLYTDASNYDDILSPGTKVTVSASANAAVPEPGTLGFFTLLSSILIACRWGYRRHANFPRTS